MDYIYGKIDPGNIDYTGLSTESADIIVDNELRTIKCNARGSGGFDLRETLPKDENGNYIEGNYSLTVSIVNNELAFLWTKLSAGDVFCGVTDAEQITEEIVSTLPDVGPSKKTYECIFQPYKQKSVFAYPKAFGELSSIRHKETGFEVLSGWSKISIDYKGMPYLVYFTSNSTGKYTYIFTY